VVLARPALGEVVDDSGRLARAQGCLLGQIAGDSLGTPYEGRSAAEVAARCGPIGPRTLCDADGARPTLAGQPTDDSELALALARTLVRTRGFDAAHVRAAYEQWLASEPPWVGRTTRAGLTGRPDATSQANGALMRVSPLGLLAHAATPDQAAAWARAEAALTHPHPVCADASAAFVVAIAHAISQGAGARGAYEAALTWARGAAQVEVLGALERAAQAPPVCDGPQAGYVLIALQNAFHVLLHHDRVEDALAATVLRGGDTDTNAAIAGALLGAVHGRAALPDEWRALVLACRAHALRSSLPRPAAYWPTDVLELAECLLLAGADDRSTR
jgi:ADP-ribosylglycohydrolase